MGKLAFFPLFYSCMNSIIIGMLKNIYCTISWLNLPIWWMWRHANFKGLIIKMSSAFRPLCLEIVLHDHVTPVLAYLETHQQILLLLYYKIRFIKRENVWIRSFSTYIFYICNTLSRFLGLTSKSVTVEHPRAPALWGRPPRRCKTRSDSRTRER